MEIIMPAYQTMEEYHCLMMEAQIEYYLWEEYWEAMDRWEDEKYDRKYNW